MDLRLPFKEGLTLEGREQMERILKLSRDAVWPCSERCAKILDRVAVEMLASLAFPA